MAGHDKKLLAQALAVACASLGAPGAAAQGVVQPVPGIDLRLSDSLRQEREEESAPAVRAQAAPGEEELRRPVQPFRGLHLRFTAEPGYDDNVLRSEDDPRGSFVIRLRPSVTLDGGYRKHSAQLRYEGEVGRFASVPEEGYFDNRLSTRVRLDLSRRLDVDLEAEAELGHDSRGALGTRLAAAPEPDRWRRLQGAAEVRYGRRIARAQLTGRLEYQGIRYLNNGQSFRDFDRLTSTGHARWNLAPRWSLLLEGSLSDIDYVLGSSPLDSTETSLLAGVAWEATAKTRGEVKLGLMSKRFDGDTFQDFSGTRWDAEVFWNPKPYSEVRAYTSRETQESSEAGASHLVDSKLGIGWRHALTERLSFDTRAEYNLADFSDARRDELLDLRGEFTWKARSWLDLGAVYVHSRRASSEAGASFVDNLLLLRIAAFLERRPEP